MSVITKGGIEIRFPEGKSKKPIFPETKLCRGDSAREFHFYIDIVPGGKVVVCETQQGSGTHPYASNLAWLRIWLNRDDISAADFRRWENNPEFQDLVDRAVAGWQEAWDGDLRRADRGEITEDAVVALDRLAEIVGGWSEPSHRVREKAKYAK